MEIKCLDHGHVRLVEHVGGDLSVVRSARVSYDAAWRAGQDEGSDYRLINYLMKNHHTSPFESVFFTFDVKAPIFNFRQWHRHRTWKYNEQSARYSELPEVFYVPEPDKIGVQSTSNKQQRNLTAAGGPQREMADAIWNSCTASFKAYRELLAKGCPRELARGVLPVNTYSHMFASVDLHNLLHFIRLRAHSHAQYEIRVYAEALLKIAAHVAPISVAAFRTHILGETDEQRTYLG